MTERIRNDHLDSTATTEGAHATRGAARDAVEAQHERYGGIKWGAAFFGWLSANGLAVLLLAILSASGVAFGLSQVSSADQAAQQATSQADTIGIAGGIALLVVLFLAYLAGGYVAGRMARFDGSSRASRCGSSACSSSSCSPSPALSWARSTTFCPSSTCRASRSAATPPPPPASSPASRPWWSPCLPPSSAASSASATTARSTAPATRPDNRNSRPPDPRLEGSGGRP